MNRTTHSFLLKLCWVWIGGCFLNLPAFCEQVPGTLSHLSLFHTHFQWELYVHEKDMDKVCGLTQENLLSLKENEKATLETRFRRHIRLRTDAGMLFGSLVHVKFQKPHYGVITLKFPIVEDPEHFEAEYDFENTFDGSDRTTLVFYDQRFGKKDPWITLLHDSKKKVRWTPQGLQNEVLAETSPIQSFPWGSVGVLVAALWIAPLRGNLLGR